MNAKRFQVDVTKYNSIWRFYGLNRRRLYQCLLMLREWRKRYRTGYIESCVARGRRSGKSDSQPEKICRCHRGRPVPFYYLRPGSWKQGPGGYRKFNWQRRLFLCYYHTGNGCADHHSAQCTSSVILCGLYSGSSGRPGNRRHRTCPCRVEGNRGPDRKKNGPRHGGNIWREPGKSVRRCRTFYWRLLL